jgi:hypothetical protein
VEVLRRGEHRRWGIDVLIPGTPALPETEVAVVRVLGSGSDQLEQGTPLVNLVRRCVGISVDLLLVCADGVRNEANARVGGEACRAKRHQPLPGKIAGDDPACRRHVCADTKRHVWILELILLALSREVAQIGAHVDAHRAVSIELPLSTHGSYSVDAFGGVVRRAERTRLAP